MADRVLDDDVGTREPWIRCAPAAGRQRLPERRPRAPAIHRLPAVRHPARPRRAALRDPRQPRRRRRMGRRADVRPRHAGTVVDRRDRRRPAGRARRRLARRSRADGVPRADPPRGGRTLEDRGDPRVAVLGRLPGFKPRGASTIRADLRSLRRATRAVGPRPRLPAQPADRRRDLRRHGSRRAHEGDRRGVVHRGLVGSAAFPRRQRLPGPHARACDRPGRHGVRRGGDPSRREDPLSPS